MIAHRLRPLGWVAAVALAALAFYLVSLRVASERGALEDVDHKILLAERDIRQLQTELGTRASLRQLERWNGEVLALAAPGAAQYLRDGVQLASLTTRDKPAGPVQVVRPVEPAIHYAVVTRDEDEGEKPLITRTALKTDAEPASAAAQPVARLQKVALVQEGTMAEIVKRARREAGDGGR